MHLSAVRPSLRPSVSKAPRNNARSARRNNLLPAGLKAIAAATDP